MTKTEELKKYVEEIEKYVKELKKYARELKEYTADLDKEPQKLIHGNLVRCYGSERIIISTEFLSKRDLEYNYLAIRKDGNVEGHWPRNSECNIYTVIRNVFED